MKSITFVFPVYNEEKGLDKLYEEILKVIVELEKKYIVDVIMINDGSKDKSLDKLISIHNNDERFTIINFSRNFHHQMALTAGLDYASGDAVIIMDADLQDPPEVALELVSKWEEGFEVVYAQRRSREDSFFKKFTAGAFYWIIEKLAEINIPRNTGDFRLMDKKAVEAFRQFRERNRFIRGMVPYLGFKQVGVFFDRHERFAGASSYPLSRMIKLALDGITSFSAVPLKLITQFGFIVSALSFLGIFYAIFMKIFFPDVTVSGFTFIVIAILFIGGVQMIMLGILGTYIGRIYSEVQQRPLYVISSIYSKRKK